ncbi:MAG: T9SS type A sorting domain-containing protein [Bacteroidales bacterium]|nr:T9SS type A sorting domain-containing protein [Bacteroidales bacterium]MBN2818742.1 T9SS type A sorting domain-containing protein [Bacteroidales bacterium]
MNKHKLVLGITFMLVVVFLSNLKSSAQDPNFHIYICFGQSNMEGQGPIEAQDKVVDERFKTFQALDCSNLSRTKAEWYTAVPPTCQCWSRLSPADYFGRTMVANLPDSITIGIVNVAIGGCDIRLFDKDIYEDYDSTYTDSWFTDKVEAYEWNPYQYLIDLAKLAQQDGVIKGILLHQGETNTGQAEWPTYVKKIYNDMLTDLSLDAESTPILAGEVLDVAGACCSSMNSIINRLPDTIPNSFVISSDNLTGQDYAHFDSEGYRRFGRRYAVQMLSIMGYEAINIETECGTVGESWKTKKDAKASNGAYITITDGMVSTSSAPTDAAGTVEMTFSVSKDTTYYLFCRFDNPGTDADAYWVKVDDGEYVLYDNLTTSGWEWIELSSFDLTAGNHTLSLAYAEDSGKIDKLVLKNAQITPVDVAEEAPNLCTPEISASGITDKINADNGYSLEQNYPNPFNGNTTISFKMPQKTYVSLKLYNLLGVEIAELAGREFQAGKNSIEFSLAELSEGTYFYTLKAGKYLETRKMVLLAD